MELPNASDIIRELRNHRLFRLRHAVLEVFIVGSFATGMQNSLSDIDVCLRIRRQKRTTEEIEENYRKRLRDFFVKNNIRGRNDQIHPQWNGRRIDVYFTFSTPDVGKPFVKIG